MAEVPPSRTADLPWHGRLETRVAVALAVLVAGALGAMLLITIQLVSTQSRTRAEDELDVARSAFSSLLESRETSSIALATLVTELPVFRAHLTDARLAQDRPTVDAMADGYRLQLDATFVVVTNADGTWLANPGWADAGTPAPAPLERLLDAARHGTSGAAIVGRGGELFLAVSVPARFADEVLGTLTTGYRLTDALAEELARLAQCEVVLISGTEVAASSLEEPRAQRMSTRLVAEVASTTFGMLPQVRRIGDHQYVGGIFPLRQAADSLQGGRLLLLADWQPTQQFVDRLRGRFFAGGLVVFGLALAGGVMFSRRVSRPLRDIAAAAADIAGGNLSLQLPVRGSAEDRTVAHAFNEMSASLRVAHQRLIHDAIHDPLTLLPNRVLFMERLERAMARRVRHPEYHFAVLFIDLDRFKHVNDSLGHTVGDQLLFAFSERLASVVRHDDTVTRIVGAGRRRRREHAGAFRRRRVRDADRRHARPDRRRARGRARAGDRGALAAARRAGRVCQHQHRRGGLLARPPHPPTRSSATRTWRCIAPRAPAAAATRCLTPRCTRRRWSGCGSRPSCIVRSSGRSSACGTSRSSRCRTSGWWASRRLFGGSIRSGACSSPAPSSRWPKNLASSPPSTSGRSGEACRQAQQWRLEHPDRADVTVSVNLSAKGFGSESLVPNVIEALASERIARARAPAGDHRERGDLGCGPRAVGPQAVARARRACEPGRLRNRLLLAELSAAVPC